MYQGHLVFQKGTYEDNVNPIEKVERSSLIMAATVHQQPALAMIQDTTRARVMACSPQLFLEDAP